jgi:hypothetical protein
VKPEPFAEAVDDRDDRPRRSEGLGGAWEADAMSRRLRRNAGGPTVGTLGLGIVLLATLGLMALLPYSLESVTVHWSGGAVNAGGSNIPDTTSIHSGPQGVTRWQGRTILEVSLAMALVVGIGLAEAMLLEPPAGGKLLDATSGLAIGWGGAAILWHLGLVIRGFRSPHLHFASVRTYPGYGLWLGLLMAVVVAGLFTFLLGYRGRQPWLGAGWAAGLLAGLGLVVIELTAKT